MVSDGGVGVIAGDSRGLGGRCAGGGVGLGVEAFRGARMVRGGWTGTKRQTRITVV